MDKRCTHCNKPIEEWASENEDRDGNLYCMECVSKVEIIAEGGE